MKFPGIADVLRAGLSDLTIVFYQFVTGKGLIDAEEEKNILRQVFGVFVYNKKYWINTVISTRFMTFLILTFNVFIAVLSPLDYRGYEYFNTNFFETSLNITFYFSIYYLIIFYLKIDNKILYTATCAVALIISLLLFISNYQLNFFCIIVAFFYGNALLKIILGATSDLRQVDSLLNSDDGHRGGTD